jgi:hypothetical protein
MEISRTPEFEKQEPIDSAEQQYAEGTLKNVTKQRKQFTVNFKYDNKF